MTRNQHQQHIPLQKRITCTVQIPGKRLQKKRNSDCFSFKCFYRKIILMTHKKSNLYLHCGSMKGNHAFALKRAHSMFAAGTELQTIDINFPGCLLQVVTCQESEHPLHQRTKRNVSVRHHITLGSSSGTKLCVELSRNSAEQTTARANCVKQMRTVWRQVFWNEGDQLWRLLDEDGTSLESITRRIGLHDQPGKRRMEMNSPSVSSGGNREASSTVLA